MRIRPAALDVNGVELGGSAVLDAVPALEPVAGTNEVLEGELHPAERLGVDADGRGARVLLLLLLGRRLLLDGGGRLGSGGDRDVRLHDVGDRGDRGGDLLLDLVRRVHGGVGDGLEDVDLGDLGNGRHGVLDLGVGALGDDPRVDVAPVRALGDVKRSGAWIVPPESRYRSWMGHIRLDLRQARISEPEVHIHAWALFGTIDLLVPEGVEVDVQARAKLGQLKQEAGSAYMPGAPRIVLTGGTVFGEIKVRHRRLWEKLVRLAR